MLKVKYFRVLDFIDAFNNFLIVFLLYNILKCGDNINESKLLLVITIKTLTLSYVWLFIIAS